MAKDNPMNPHTRDDTKTKREMPTPFSKATVEAADSHPDEHGYHTVRIRVYGEEHGQNAPVLPPTFGGAYVPPPNSDVAVIFGRNEQPWVIGPWYAVDRVDNGEVDIPEYEPGEVIYGNETDSYIKIDNSGDIHIESEGDVYINGERQ